MSLTWGKLNLFLYQSLSLIFPYLFLLPHHFFSLPGFLHGADMQLSRVRLGESQ